MVESYLTRTQKEAVILASVFARMLSGGEGMGKRTEDADDDSPITDDTLTRHGFGV